MLKMVNCERYWMNVCEIRERRPIPHLLGIVGNDRNMEIQDDGLKSGIATVT